MGEAVSLLLRLGLAFCSGACPLGVEKGTWIQVNVTSNDSDNDNEVGRVLETRVIMDVVFISILRETDVACTINIVLPTPLSHLLHTVHPAKFRVHFGHPLQPASRILGKSSSVTGSKKL